MKILAFLFALALPAFSQVAGQYKVPKKNVGAGWSDQLITPAANSLFAWNGSGQPIATLASDFATAANLTSGLATKQPLASVLTNTTASFTAAQETKLAGIATAATANSSDATLLDLGNHTGTLAAARIADAALSIAKTSGLQTALDGKFSLAGNNTITGQSEYNGATWIYDAPAKANHQAALDILTPTGNGSGLTALNGSQITTGTVAAARVATLNQSTTGSAATLTTPRTIGGSSFDGSGNVTSFPTAGAIGATDLAVAKGTITTSQPNTLTQTWNASGTTFAARRTNITNTASAAASLLEDWQVGGSSRLSVRVDGRVFLSSGSYFYDTGTFWLNGAGFQIGINSNGLLISANSDLGIGRSAAGVAEINSGTAGTLRDLTLRHLTASGYIAHTPDAQTATTAAVSVATGLTKLTTTAGAQAITLANGVDGQEKTIVHDVDGGSAILTPATKTGFSTVTFTNVGETVTLVYVTTRGWMVKSSYGAVVAP